MFQFNNWFVDYVMHPVGNWGSANLPDGVRHAARNMYSNLSEPEFILTNLFQGQFADAGIATGRVLVNTVVGIGGIYDPATRWGIVSRQPEFSESVCNLGVPAGDYLVVPLVGPGNTNAGIVLAGFMVGHIYLISLISPWLAAADAAADTVVGAAMLRHSDETVGGAHTDPYTVQRREYFEYLSQPCAD